MKLTFKTITVKLDLVRCDPTIQRVAKHAKNSDFFYRSVKRSGYYTVPPAYEKNGYYYLVGFKSSVDALLVNGANEVAINLIDLSQEKIIEFLCTFQYQEHKEERCLAELIKICLEYTSTPNGRKWLKQITKSEDKEKQFSEIFDLSNSSSKYYFKLLQPGNEKFLELLSDPNNYYVSRAYNECVAAERPTKNQSSKEKAPAPISNTSGQKISVAENAASSVEGNPGVTPQNVDTSIAGKQPSQIAGENLSDEPTFLRHLDKYKRKAEAQPKQVQPAKDLVQKIIVIFSDGMQLELAGDIMLTVDGKQISSTSQLGKQADGSWALTKHSGVLSLTTRRDKPSSNKLAA